MTTDIINYKRAVAPITTQADELVIMDRESMAEAVELLSQANKMKDFVTTEREKVTKPLNEALKAERARWKPLETDLENGIANIRSKMGKYQTEADRKAKEKEASIAARIGEGKGKLKIETAVAKLASIETPDQEVSTDSGSVKFRTVQKFEIIDITMVPSEYLLPNEPLIRQAIAKAVEIPGIRYFEEQIPVNYR